jgi:hypothetical protein
MDKQLVVTCNEYSLTEGLFGGIILWLMEILPGLERIDPMPRFEIKSIKYGNAPDFIVVPGVLEEKSTYHQDVVRASFLALRNHPMMIYVLGDDFKSNHDLFNRFFSIPKQLTDTVDNLIEKSSSGNFDRTLGVHYRGTDKNVDHKQTNPVSKEYMCSIVADVLKNNADIDQIFLATDQYDFLHFLENYISVDFPGRNMPIINCGETHFWKDIDITKNDKKANDAMIDCILLSKCQIVVKCQSALSAFAKVLNPNLQIYSVSASKMFADIPYWPDAYIEKYRSNDPEIQTMIDRNMVDDWTHNMDNRNKFKNFATMRRYS